MPYRILILQSVRDETTARRELQIRKDPFLREHTFEHIYAVEPAALDETQPLPARVLQTQQNSLDEKALLRRLTDCIDEFQPDMLMVQSGSVFLSYPDQMLLVLQVLKASRPQLRIGFQPRPFERYGPKPFFEYTREMHDLMSKVFQGADTRNTGIQGNT